MTKLKNGDGQTQWDPEERLQLIPSDIATQSQLNEAEQKNIIEARVWATGKKHRDLFSEAFVRKLHGKMFSLVWRWAGTYRKTDKNIGEAWFKILEEIYKLMHDIRYWIEETVYPWDESCARFHHRLVSIHPFPNGNGRHARLMTDLILLQNGRTPFSWGEKTGTADLSSGNATRTRYLEALRAADRRNITPLLVFVRS